MSKKYFIIFNFTGILHFQEICFVMLTWAYDFLYEESE
jgi:hypothetical protein